MVEAVSCTTQRKLNVFLTFVFTILSGKFAKRLHKIPDYFFFCILALLQTKLHFDPITSEDVESAIRRTKPSGMAFSEKYRKWQEKFGSS